MDKKLIKKIREEIKESSIPEELKVLYLMASATETLSQDAFRRCKAVYVKNGIKVTDNPLLTGLNDYCEAVMKASWHFFHRVEPQINSATFGAFYDRERPETTKDAVAAWDQFEADANEMCRLILLYVDRTVKNDVSCMNVFETLSKLPSCGLFSDEDIARFKLQ